MHHGVQTWNRSLEDRQVFPETEEILKILIFSKLFLYGAVRIGLLNKLNKIFHSSIPQTLNIKHQLENTFFPPPLDP